MNRMAVVIAVVALAAVVVWQFPLFHVVPREQVVGERREAAFDVRQFAVDFWKKRLTPRLEQAADAATVLAALRDNPQRAREEFGRQVGVSRTAYYFLRGRATIQAVDEGGVRVALSTDSASPEILLRTGLVFDNTVRDATGLLVSANFPNSQHFNDLAAELNRLAGAGPIKELKAAAAPGRRVEFVGCAAITGNRFDSPLKVIPVFVNVE